MKKLKWMALIAVGWAGLMNCKPKVVEEPKVENCLKVRYLGVGCKHPFFETLDTAKFKGTYVKDWDGTDKGSVPADNSYVFVNFYQDTTLVKKLTKNQIYFVEYQVVKKENRLQTISDRLCFPGAKDFEQLIIKNILTSNCTKQP